MTEDRQLHMEVVVQRRIPCDRHGNPIAQAPAEAPAKAAPEQSAARSHSAGSAGSHGSHHNSRRHYADYGTLNLGSLEAAPVEAPAPQEQPKASPAGAEDAARSYGEDQQAFFRKYDELLQRRYATRNKSKVVRLLGIVLIAAAVLIASILALNKYQREENALAEPQKETIPVVTLNLGDAPEEFPGELP